MNPGVPADRVPGGSERNPPLRERFRHVSHLAASAMGSPWAFAGAVLVILVWAILGPRFGFSDTWQLVINTGTTIVTFLMVFLIQNTQNRDARAIQLKLDELIRGNSQTRNQLIDLEECTEEELAALEQQFRRLRARAAPAGDGAPREGPGDSATGAPT